MTWQLVYQHTGCMNAIVHSRLQDRSQDHVAQLDDPSLDWFLRAPNRSLEESSTSFLRPRLHRPPIGLRCSREATWQKDQAGKESEEALVMAALRFILKRLLAAHKRLCST